MNQLDDFFKDKLQPGDATGRFAYREEYWQQAEALIAADETRRRQERRRFWRWLLPLALLAVLSIWQFARPAGAGFFAKKENGPASNHEAGRTPNRQTAKPETPETTSAFGTNAKTQASALTSGEANSPGETQSRNSLARTGNSDVAVTPGAATVSGRASAADSAAAKGGRFSGAKSAGFGKPSEAENLPSKNPGVFQSPENQVFGDKNLNPKNVDAAKTGAEKIWTEKSPGDFQGQKIRPAKSDFLPLPTPLLPLPQPVRQFSIPEKWPPPVAENIKPSPSNDFRWGLAAGGNGWLDLGNGPFVDASGGLTARRVLNRHLSLQLDGLLRYRFTGRQDESTTSERTEYAYGFTATRTAAARRGLLWLEMPLALQWQRKTLIWEAGISPAFFLAARERRTDYARNSFVETETKTATNRVWLRPEEVRKANFGIFAGIQSKPGPRGLSLGLRANWLPGDEKPSADAPNFSDNHLRLDLGIRWTPFAPAKNSRLPR